MIRRRGAAAHGNSAGSDSSSRYMPMPPPGMALS
jgi:hypothetical protein